MARLLVLDTSTLILVTRQPPLRLWINRVMRTQQARLPAVVIAELYAGTRSRADAAWLAGFLAPFYRHTLVLLPDLADWELAGRLINRRARPFGPEPSGHGLAGELNPRDHWHDLLIAIGAARVGGTVVTTNVHHIEPWANLLNAGGYDITVTPFPLAP